MAGIFSKVISFIKGPAQAVNNITAIGEDTPYLELDTHQEWEQNPTGSPTAAAGHNAEQIRLRSLNETAKSVLAFRWVGNWYQNMHNGVSNPKGDTVLGLVGHFVLNPLLVPLKEFTSQPADWTTYNQRIVGSGGTSTTRTANSLTWVGHGITTGTQMWASGLFDGKSQDVIGGLADGQNESYFVRAVDANTLTFWNDPACVTNQVRIFENTSTHTSTFRMLITNRWIHKHVSFETASPDLQVHTRLGMEVLKYFATFKFTQVLLELAGAGVDLWFSCGENAFHRIFWGLRRNAPLWAFGRDNNANKNFRLTAYDDNHQVSRHALNFNRLTPEAGVNISTLVSGVNWQVGGTGGISIPIGTTAQRPTLGTGDRILRWNTDTVQFELWNGTTWRNITHT